MKSGINRVEFYNNQYYDENFLDRLVKAASEILSEFYVIHNNLLCVIKTDNSLFGISINVALLKYYMSC